MSRKVADVDADLSQFKRDLVERLDRVEKTMEIMREEAKARHEEARKHHEEAEKRHAELMALLVKLPLVPSLSPPPVTANVTITQPATTQNVVIPSPLAATQTTTISPPLAPQLVVITQPADTAYLIATTFPANIKTTTYFAADPHPTANNTGYFSTTTGPIHSFSGLWGYAKHRLRTWLEQNFMFQPILQFHYDQQAIDFQVRIWDPGIT